jgi:hypothetical protein
MGHFDVICWRVSADASECEICQAGVGGDVGLVCEGLPDFFFSIVIDVDYSAERRDDVQANV